MKKRRNTSAFQFIYCQFEIYWILLDCNRFDHWQIFDSIIPIHLILVKKTTKNEFELKSKNVLTKWNYIHLSGLLSKKNSLRASNNYAIESVRGIQYGLKERNGLNCCPFSMSENWKKTYTKAVKCAHTHTQYYDVFLLLLFPFVLKLDAFYLKVFVLLNRPEWWFLCAHKLCKYWSGNASICHTHNILFVFE